MYLQELINPKNLELIFPNKQMLGKRNSYYYIKSFFKLKASTINVFYLSKLTVSTFFLFNHKKLIYMKPQSAGVLLFCGS